MYSHQENTALAPHCLVSISVFCVNRGKWQAQVAEEPETTQQNAFPQWLDTNVT